MQYVYGIPLAETRDAKDILENLYTIPYNVALSMMGNKAYCFYPQISEPSK